MSKLPNLPSKLDPKQEALYQKLTAKRGRIDEMYRTLLNHPLLTEHVSDLGTYLRFEGVLPGNIREFCILFTAHLLHAEYEWLKHLQPALDAGVSQEVIDAIKSGSTIFPLPYSHLIPIVTSVLDLQSIPVDSQNQIISSFGIKGIIEMVVLVGFYRMIAGIIFSFDVPLPD